MAARRVEGVEIERTADEILAKEGSLEAHAITRALLPSTICATGTPQSLGWPPRLSPHGPSRR